MSTPSPSRIALRAINFGISLTASVNDYERFNLRDKSTLFGFYWLHFMTKQKINAGEFWKSWQLINKYRRWRRKWDIHIVYSSIKHSYSNLTRKRRRKCGREQKVDKIIFFPFHSSGCSKASSLSFSKVAWRKSRSSEKMEIFRIWISSLTMRRLSHLNNKFWAPQGPYREIFHYSNPLNAKSLWYTRCQFPSFIIIIQKFMRFCILLMKLCCWKFKGREFWRHFIHRMTLIIKRS